MAGNRTRVNCLEGSYAHHYTTIAVEKQGIPLQSQQFVSGIPTGVAETEKRRREPRAMGLIGAVGSPSVS
ncbi:uncharacterized protein AKAME5_000753700 [Lates japonicus]|uniref:Uncharacterized protein n=1 Tax=Lates japonicus TaxID=270547 RepID=A0AAD3MJK5_LATJO|nr:uncharacterized protein AKAME5_000753700 [Lates japonicus]